MTKCVILPPYADLKAVPKYCRSPSMPANPSPMGTPQRKAAEAHQSQVCRFDCFYLYFVALDRP